jgi:two-component system, OmpR family, copper resistance phosphate regulon response regulator CusR
MKLLLIEDDEKTARFLKQGLLENGILVDVCRDGAEGLDAARSQPYDLVLLDVMLPEVDGWTVLAELRRNLAHIPVVMLTAQDGVEQRVRGLTAGADDYLVKPFAFSELLARIRTVLRRSKIALPEALAFEDLKLDPKRFVVERAGVKIELTAKEFALLELLLRQNGEVLSRTYITEQVWDMAFDGNSNVVEVTIARLRSKIDDAHARKLIHTIRGRGYVVR